MQQIWTIPGTILKEPRDDAPFISRRFAAMFLGGGMLLSQVVRKRVEQRLRLKPLHLTVALMTI